MRSGRILCGQTMFADDSVISRESRERVEEKREMWMEVCAGKWRIGSGKGLWV